MHLFISWDKKLNNGNISNCTVAEYNYTTTTDKADGALKKCQLIPSGLGIIITLFPYL